MSTQLQFMHPTHLITQDLPSWRPPSIPPPENWVISIDTNGKDLSLYGDDYWDYSSIGFRGFNFGKQQLSINNEKLVKQCLIVVLYHPKLFPGKISSSKVYFDLLVKIAKTCDQHGILLNNISRHPRIIPSISQALRCSKYDEYINKLHKLKLYSNDIGFTIADDKTLRDLTVDREKHEIIQHPYIPSRIWIYQLKRLSECIDDFNHHRLSIKKAFNWLSNVYENNTPLVAKNYISPFSEREKYRNKRITYQGNFQDFLREHGLYDLFEKWLDVEKRLTVSEFTSYLNLVVQASLFYILNFSLQRLGEVASLRTDCFKVEKDEKLGNIALIVGETTKTDPDSDARWVVPETLKIAVETAAFIAKLRDRHNPSRNLKIRNGRKHELFLFTPAWEPWRVGRDSKILAKREFLDFRALIIKYPKLFDKNSITVTDDDWKVALSLTPNLHKKPGFGVGLSWRFSAHQLRRTTTINMFASSMVSDKTLQWQMKHLSRYMTLYYGRNYTNLRLNSEAETTVIIESYNSIFRQLIAIVDDSVEYVRNLPLISRRLSQPGGRQIWQRFIAKNALLNTRLILKSKWWS
ncbi:MAG: hypothetical protein VYA99_07790 [Pseudomonadota bacterium]|nr:hypothetical protein [Pseudomonadota bacterium]